MQVAPVARRLYHRIFVRSMTYQGVASPQSFWKNLLPILLEVPPLIVREFLGLSKTPNNLRVLVPGAPGLGIHAQHSPLLVHLEASNNMIMVMLTTNVHVACF